jgi:type I restriction enzyme M protein
MKLQQILKDSNYKLTQFSQDMVEDLENRIIEKESKGKITYKVTCLIRDKEINLTPEEVVRQLYLLVLLQDYAYPKNRLQLEYSVSFGTEKKRADIVIMDKDRPEIPYIIVELKKPKLKEGKEQLKSYCNATGAPMGVWTNGDSISYYHRKDPNYFEDIPHIPRANERLTDVLSERWTIDDLIKHDKLINERKSLKDLILEMEDEVLANAGVDVFEEMFKLVFAKLYDEMLGGRDKKRYLVFKNYGETETELKTKIQDLFDKACEKWEGVFSTDSKLQLTPSHLAVCVASLEKVKLFNSNLDVVDEAFEYLINKTSKGEKGQYFTPRYVIDMCVKMLNPKEDETMIDTAAGSCGFPIHTMFHVWKQILADENIAQSHLFTLEKKPVRCEDYAQSKVFAIDFDEKAVRVGRTLNLIAGDGQTNVLHLNTLDFERWDEKTDDHDWLDIYNDAWKRLRKLREDKTNKRFNFDILMANPPFAGDIKETRMLAKYELCKKPDGKIQTAVGRDILFIERNLNFLKDGGRMAVVLPQGRFNNSSDKAIREFIAERCRVLAVVGLHGNVFKPHTGTKTSVLFLQKWTDDKGICPKCEDYPIFFATMQTPSKDNSGDKIYVKQANGEFLLDEHGHLIVEHDLFNHESLTQDGIAEAFVEFAKKENLSFFESSPFDEVKYRALLEGLEISEVMLSYILANNEIFRFDSSYFLKNFLKTETLVRNNKFDKLKNLVSSIKSFGAYSLNNQVEYLDKGIPFIRAVDMKNSTINFDGILYISNDAHKLLWKSEVKPEMVLLSMSGTIGNVAIASKNWTYPINSSQDLAKIDTNWIINPYFLYCFLSSKFGQQFLKREERGSIQQHVFLSQIEQIEIPLFGHFFLVNIEETIKLAHSKREASKTAYTAAENLLLETLGLKDFQPTQQNISIKSLKESFLTSGRLDAEYYQPKYEEIEGKIKGYEFGYQRLSELVSIQKSVETGSDAYAETGIPYVRVSNLTQYGISTPDICISDSYYQKNKKVLDNLKIKKDTVLLSKDGSVGIAYKVSEDLNMLTSGALLHLTLKNSDEFLPDCLALILNSEIVQKQAERDAGGSIIVHWRVAEIEKVLIPMVEKETQTQIAKLLHSEITIFNSLPSSAW